MTPFQVIGHSPITHYCYLILHIKNKKRKERRKKEESVRQYRCEHPFIRLYNPSIPLDRRINNIVLSSGLSSLQTRHLHYYRHPYHSQLGSCIYLIFLLFIIEPDFYAHIKKKKKKSGNRTHIQTFRNGRTINTSFSS